MNLILQSYEILTQCKLQIEINGSSTVLIPVRIVSKYGVSVSSNIYDHEILWNKPGSSDSGSLLSAELSCSGEQFFPKFAFD